MPTLDRAWCPSRPAEVDEVDLVPVRTYWQLVRQRFLHHKLAVIAVITLIIIVVASFGISFLAGDAYQKSSLSLINAPPSLSAPLGYNGIGQNVFLRLMKATQTSLIIGFASVLIIAGIGSLVGSLAGYFGGWVDNALMRFVDVILSLPYLFLVLLIVAFFGIRDVKVIVIAIGIAGWTTAARLVRAEFLSLRETDFVAAAKALGASPRRIIVRHMLPGAHRAPRRRGLPGCRRRDHRRGGPVRPWLRHRAARDQPRPDAPRLPRLLLHPPGVDLLSGHHARRHRAVRQLPR